MKPPSKLSVHDAGYDPSIGNVIRVLLDGVEQSKVISYDTEAGRILRYATDAAGMFKLNESRDEAETEEVLGKVEVHWLSAAAAA